MEKTFEGQTQTGVTEKAIKWIWENRPKKGFPNFRAKANFLKKETKKITLTWTEEELK